MQKLRVSKQSNKPRDIRNNNQQVIFAMFRKANTLSVPEIASHVKLSTTTVAKIVEQLEQENMICSMGKGQSTNEGGKKPLLYRINEQHRFGVSLNFENAMITGALFDFCCQCVLTDSIPCAVDKGYPELVDASVRMIHMLLDKAGLDESRLYGVVFCCDGIIDSDNGLIKRSARYPSWGQNLPLREDIASCFGQQLDVYIDNGCRYGGYAEMVHGSYHDYSCIATVYTNHFTGGCILRQGQLQNGVEGILGEFGHVIIEPASSVSCSCGNRGCFEALVSQEHVLERAKKMVKKFPGTLFDANSSDISSLFELANQGDALARKVMDEVVACYATLLHNIAMMHNPDLIIIQGIYARSGEYFNNMLMTQLKSIKLYGVNSIPKVVFSKVHDVPDFLPGGALFALDRYLEGQS